MNAPLVPVALAFLAGILGRILAAVPAAPVIGLGVASAVAALGWRHRRPSTLLGTPSRAPVEGRRSGMAALLLLWACLGMLRMACWLAHPDARLAARLPEEPQAVRLHAVVVSDPTELFEPEEPAGARAVLRLLHRRTDDGWEASAGLLMATMQRLREPLAYGDELLVEGEWSEVPAPGNPGQYDRRAALARHRIHGQLRVRPFHGLVRLRSHRGAPLVGGIARLRHRWEDLLERYFARQDADLLRSLLLGQRRRLDPELKDAFLETGTVHLLVISGFNVGLIAWLLEFAARLFGLPWRARLVFSALGLGGFCLLAELQPPVARATLMAWVVLGALALDRVVSWPNTLAAAALAILWVNPMQLFDPGFQLSFGAVLSLMVLVPRWSAWLDRRTAWVRPAWLRRYLALSVAATGAVWAGLVPVLAWYFHLLSPVSVLANLLVAPLMSGLIVLGTVLLAAGTAADTILRWGRGPLGWLLQATVQAVSWCHALPFGSWVVGPPSPLIVAGYYGLVGISLLRVRFGWTRTVVLAGWAAGLAVWLGAGAALRAWESRWLRVDVLDVGHGDSILLRGAPGHAILIDAGSEDAGQFRVVPSLRALGIRSLDALVLTHPDEDHIGGTAPLLRALRVERLLTNGVRDDTMSARRVGKLAAARRIPEVVLARGMRLEAGPGVALDVLHPPPGLVPGSPPASNDNSVVLRATKGSVSLLLTGDIEEAGLPWLIGNGMERLRADILKIPHHGSRLGEAGERLFDAVTPRLAILSVGRAHRLPAPETMEALRRRGIAVLSTERDGAVSLRTDGARLEVRTFRESKRWRRIDD